MMTSTPLAKRLRVERERAGFTQAAVAGAVVRDQRTIERYESGQSKPPRSVLTVLARLYEAPDLLESA